MWQRSSHQNLKSWVAQAFICGIALAFTFVAAAAERKYSKYELESIAAALAELGSPKRELRPEGKLVEGIEVVTLEVIEPRDPAPGFLNWFHSTTRDSVVRQEVLLVPGQRFTQALADETERNLRVLPQLSVVLIVPLRGSEPDRVKILVVTKDVWSLRLATQPEFHEFKVTALSIQPAETNLFGIHHVLAGNVSITPDNYWLGATYVYPRIGRSRVRASLNVNAVFNCDSGELEGATGSFLYGQPLYSSLAKWSWQAMTTWSSLIGRPLSREQQEQARSICSGGQPQQSEFLFPVEQRDTSGGDTVRARRFLLTPIEYRRESLAGQFVLTRSFFRRNKLDFSTGVQTTSSRLSWLEVAPEDSQRFQVEARFDADDVQIGESVVEPLGFDAQDLATAVAGRVSSGQRRISPYVQVHGYANRWLRTINYNTLGLQEDWRMGHEFYLRVFPSFHPLSSHDVLGTYASASYSWPIQDGFARVLAAAHLEVGTLVDGFQESDLDGPVEDEPVLRQTASRAIADTDYRLGVHFASPGVGVGRVVADVSARYRPFRTFFGALGTGGTDRLRGYNAFEFVDDGVVNVNVELRTRPLQLFSILGGLALFYDAGGAFGLETAAGNTDARSFQFDGGHSLGLGFRVLSPQLDRDVFRIDFGFPLEARDGLPFGFIARFNHAFFPPSSSPPALLRQ